MWQIYVKESGGAPPSGDRDQSFACSEDPRVRESPDDMAGGGRLDYGVLLRGVHASLAVDLMTHSCTLMESQVRQHTRWSSPC